MLSEKSGFNAICIFKREGKPPFGFMWKELNRRSLLIRLYLKDNIYIVKSLYPNRKPSAEKGSLGSPRRISGNRKQICKK